MTLLCPPKGAPRPFSCMSCATHPWSKSRLHGIAHATSQKYTARSTKRKRPHQIVCFVHWARPSREQGGMLSTVRHYHQHRHYSLSSSILTNWFTRLPLSSRVPDCGCSPLVLLTTPPQCSHAHEPAQWGPCHNHYLGNGDGKDKRTPTHGSNVSGSPSLLLP